jgi:hypothetical protein
VRGVEVRTNGMFVVTVVAAWVAFELSEEYRDDSLEVMLGGVGVSTDWLAGMLGGEKACGMMGVAG